jgi:hypothetical protein
MERKGEIKSKKVKYWPLKVRWLNGSAPDNKTAIRVQIRPLPIPL